MAQYTPLPYADEETYLSLMDHVLKQGKEKEDRTNTGTYSVFGADLKYDLSEGRLPLITTKEINVVAIQNETDWFLSGDTNTQTLNRLGTRIWDLWAEPTRHYQEPDDYVVQTYRLVDKIENEVDDVAADFFESFEHLLEEYQEKVSSARSRIMRPSDKVDMAVYLKYLEHTYHSYARQCGWGDQAKGLLKEEPTLTQYGVEGLGVSVLDRPELFINISKSVHGSPYHVLPYHGGRWIGEDDYIYFTGDIPTIFRYEKETEYTEHVVRTMQGKGRSVVYTEIDVSSFDVACIYRELSSTRGVMITPVNFVSRTKVIRPSLTNGNLGPIYGHQWRHLPTMDQLKALIHDLKANPSGRRHLVSAWNPQMLRQMRLPPCHVLMQFYCEELDEEEQYSAQAWWEEHVVDPDTPYHRPKYKLHLRFYMRSSDLPIGLPFNLMNYSLILCKVATTCGYRVGDVTYSSGDAHVYSDQVEMVKTQMERTPLAPASYRIYANKNWLNDEGLDFSEDIPHVEILNYEHHEAIAMPVAK